MVVTGATTSLRDDSAYSTAAGSRHDGKADEHPRAWSAIHLDGLEGVLKASGCN